ncbi:hypothetical protein I302_108728 [Kwoniella bestiolae CBS 10118]|uniref:Uncharacterized protein n=1 Tax=Kwoniella bestiolae CBS 10118 TaxID=1296100 RepID=A0A1B9FTX8_9TREE|nr:hypothetical protein I302_07865 [Kwoniella bestiolae CBS 10118]OCF22220.1 hypothetical protein I302_07865 [Kwoniella bestiolae CBS 10118]
MRSRSSSRRPSLSEDTKIDASNSTVPEFKFKIRRATTLKTPNPGDTAPSISGETKEETMTEFTLSPSELNSIASIQPLYINDEEKSSTLSRLAEQDSTLLSTAQEKSGLKLLKRSLGEVGQDSEVERSREDLESVRSTIEALLGNRHTGLRNVGVRERDRLKV